MIDTSKLDKFFEVYQRLLIQNIGNSPRKYPWYRGPETVDDLITKMRHLVVSHNGFGAIGKDTETCKATCSELGIKNTYKELNAYVQVTS